MRTTTRLLALIAFASGLVIVSWAHAADNGSSLVRLPLKGRNLVKSLAERNIEILGMGREGTIDVVADGKQLEYLYSLGVPVSVIGTPDMTSAVADLDENLGLYHTYAEMEGALNALASTYPALTELSVIGTSIEGRNLYMLKISDNASVDETEAEVLIAGNHHARELMSVDIPLKFATYLLENYGTDGTVTDMVDNREIFIAPMINPDGHVYVQNNHIGIAWWNWWRKNRRDNLNSTFGVDLNRNYGYQWGFDNIGSSPITSSNVYRGTGPFSEPETQALRDFCNSRSLSLAFSYHSYGELLLFPWGYYYGYTPDHEVYAALGDTLTSSNGYLAGNPAMGAIYITNGDSDDWMYGENSTKPSFFSFTPEVNTYEQGGFGPPDTMIEPTFQLLLPMNMLLLQLADNPHRVVGPYPPTQYAVDTSPMTHYRLSWSPNAPSDPNPAISYEVVEFKNLGSIAEDGANAMVSLWIYDGFTLSATRSYEGTGSYYSGAVNNNSSVLETATFYRVTQETATFQSRLWYNIEEHWDYLYLEVSTNEGLTWETVPGNLTTDVNPNGNNRGNGITGITPGWVLATFALDAYLGMDVRLRYNYVTDAAVLNEGAYVDLPGPVPTYESRSIIAPAVTDTSLAVLPPTTGAYTYRIRGRDAEDQFSRWSNSQDVDVPTVVGVRGTPTLASALGVNFPNPFNPSTHIPYTVGSDHGLEAAVPVTLRVYDVAGRNVATLVDGERTPGTYRAQWLGTNDRGDALPSGVYFARLTIADGETMTRKLVLLK